VTAFLAMTADFVTAFLAMKTVLVIAFLAMTADFVTAFLAMKTVLVIARSFATKQSIKSNHFIRGV
ncbi:hypothetical protein, partial [Treponema sp.]|uniref:hypothetical protein n=1 Tax=Treponema sp. TaxID=166 RepID=UPI00298E8A2E